MQSKRAELFKVLGVESRLKIIELLKEKGPLCVNELAEALGISSSAVSQHLKVLKYAGLVNDERQGYFIPYNVEIKVLERCGEILSGVCECGCSGHRHIIKAKIRKPVESVEDLKEYEKRLRKELDEVQGRIEKLRKKG
ncbi:MAG: metalloregulator ArsR/SmtB family transcription factor [bacterium]|nr:metalloregulator ArsR/SmtB family transcription factor [bacterium]